MVLCNIHTIIIDGGVGSTAKWTKEEDDALRKAVVLNDAKNWKQIATALNGKRTGVQCLHRWNKVLKV